MKKRPVPQPTCVSPYFFQHLVSSTNAPGSPLCSRDSEKQSGDKVCDHKAMLSVVAAILEECYTPAKAKVLQQRCAEEERCASVALEEILDASWKRVEEIIARNKQRRCIVEEELSRALETIDEYTFWTPEKVVERYDFPTFGGLWLHACKKDELDQVAIDVEKSRVNDAGEQAPDRDFSEDSHKGLPPSPVHTSPPPLHVPQPPPHYGTSAGGGAGCEAAGVAMPGKHNAMAWKKTEKDLLDPSKNPNCLRRLFAPILQKRHELPKSLTLFLNALQKIQTEGFPPIEALIQKGYFELPLHRPFRYISSFITRFLVEAPKSEKSEHALVELYKPAAARLKEARENLWQMGSNISPASSARSGTAELIYGTLLEELRGRKSLDEKCNSTLHAISAAVESQVGEMENRLQECDRESCKALEELQKNAYKYVENMVETVNYINSVKEEIETEYQRDHDRLLASFQAKMFQVKKSEEHQEKLARRIREITKELYTEQLKYERLLQEVVTESVGLRRLEVNHSQLGKVLKEHIPSEEIESNLQWLTDSLRQSEELRAKLVAQCQQHISRVKTDEHYRKCRVACFASENALCWSRCLNDIALLYESHYDTLVAKCETSMQLRYLLAHEKDLVLEDMSQLRRELGHLDSRWEALTKVLEELDLPVPQLSQYEQDELCKEFRCMICRLGGTRLIQAGFARLANMEQESHSFSPE